MANLMRYATKYARHAGEALYPNLWKDLAGLWVPGMGQAAGTLRDLSGRDNHGTLTNMDIAADWISGYPRGPELYMDNTEGEYADLGTRAILGDGPNTVVWRETVIADTDTFPTRWQFVVPGTSDTVFAIRVRISSGYRYLCFGQENGDCLRASDAPSPADRVGISTNFAVVMSDPASRLAADWECYIDGVQPLTVVAGSAFGDITLKNRIGYIGGSNGAQCRFGTLAVYNRKLSAPEIKLWADDDFAALRLRKRRVYLPVAAAPASGWAMGSLAGNGGLAGACGLAGIGGGLAG